MSHFNPLIKLINIICINCKETFSIDERKYPILPEYCPFCGKSNGAK